MSSNAKYQNLLESSYKSKNKFQFKIVNLFLIIVGILSSTNILYCQQDGTLDLSFNAPVHFNYDFYDNNGIASNGDIIDILKLNDNSVLIYGTFNTYFEDDVPHIIKIDENGVIDDTFLAPSFFNYTDPVNPEKGVTYLKEQEDGKIIIGGNLTYSSSENQVTRLLPNGNYDEAFMDEIGSGANQVYNVNLQSDQKIILAGGFDLFNDQESKCIIRLNQNGSLDNSFTANASSFLPNSVIYVTEILPNGKILVGGYNLIDSQQNSNVLILLNPDGSLDESFLYSNENNIAVRDLKFNSSDQLIYLISDYDKIKKINTDGSLNEILYELPENSDYTSRINEFKIWPNGNISFIGKFKLSHNDQNIRNFLTITNDGEILPDFYFYSYINGDLDESNRAYTAIEFNGNNSILVGCGKIRVGLNYQNEIEHELYFNPIYGINHLVQVKQNGELDLTFNPLLGSQFAGTYAIELEQNKLAFGIGQTYAQGKYYGIYNGKYSEGVIFTDQNGNTLEENYTNLLNTNVLEPEFLQITNDNKLLSVTARIERILENGQKDETFYAEYHDEIVPLNVSIYSVLEQNDGKYIIAGNFNINNGNNYRERIMRINPNGTYDSGFDVGRGFHSNDFSGNNYKRINTLLKLSDNSFLAAGNITDYNNNPINNVAELDYDGNFLGNFNIETNLQIRKIIKHIDNEKLIIVGDFTTINNTVSNYIAVVDYNGNVDNNFHSPFENGYEFSTYINDVLIQEDGTFIVTGKINDIPFINKLLETGDIDNSFHNGINFQPTYTNNGKPIIKSLQLLSDERILIAGSFTEIDGISRHGIAILNNDMEDEEVSVDDLDNFNKIKYYPNPVKDFLYINGKFKNVKVYNLNEQLFINIENHFEEKINLSTLKKGIYIIEISDEKSVKNTFKIIKI